MIYAVGLDTDNTFLYFLSEAYRRGIEVQPINLRAVIRTGDWRIAVPDDGLSAINVCEQRIPLDPHGSYFVRLIDLASVQSDIACAARWRNLVLALSTWLDHVPGTVVNPPGAYCDNFSKPLHEFTLQKIGFKVPKSFTSSEASRLTSFVACETVVKSVSAIRSNCRLVSQEELANLERVRGPVHLQRFVPGVDIRAHVVGNSVYSELIRSDEVDYRVTGSSREFSQWELPEDLKAKIVTATATFGLKFAGWDFKVDQHDQYWCLEANPMPGYDGYDRRLGGLITDALLRYLGPAKSTSRSEENRDTEVLAT